MTPRLLTSPAMACRPLHGLDSGRGPSVARTFLINRRHEWLLHEAGLYRAEDILALPQTIISGHPNRQVSRVAVGPVTAFLKVEHRVTWKDRLLNAWAGFGFTSKSLREAQMLRLLADYCPCGPDWIAAGEMSDGTAFLMIREVSGFVNLREHLTALPTESEKRNLARRIGEQLAHLHDAGIAHVDLYANHVLLEPQTGRIVFLDWQRAARRRSVSWAARWRDLATLAVTLSRELAPPRDRQVCLLAYMRATITDVRNRRLMRTQSVPGISRLIARLVRRRHVRAKALPAQPVAPQQLIRLDGDALCITPDCRKLWPDELPTWLQDGAVKASDARDIVLPDGGVGRMTMGCHSPSSCSGFFRTWISPERRQMSLLFRLQRHGIAVPQVLAVGDRCLSRGRMASFLFVRTRPAIALSVWMRHSQPIRARRQLLHDVGALLATVHHAGCVFSGGFADLAVGVDGRPVLTGVGRLTIRRRFRSRVVRHDLRSLERALREAGCSRTDWLRVRRGYEATTS